jgi:hypothetical protein
MVANGKSAEPDEFGRLVQRALDAESKSTPRKHHFVPDFYLKGWTEDKKIRVTHVDEDRTYVTSSGKAARKTDFYRMEAKDLDPTEVPPLMMEHVFGHIEGPVKEISDRMQSRGIAAVTQEDRYKFSLFLAVQMTRGIRFRESIRLAANEDARKMISSRSDEDYENFLKKSGDEVTPLRMQKYRDGVDAIKSGKWKFTPPEPLLIGMGFQIAVNLGPYLFDRRWEIFRRLHCS